MKYNIGDLFLSVGEVYIYISDCYIGKSELLDNQYGILYKLTFLNGKQQYKSTWVKEERITKLIYLGTYKHYPVKK
jgi:hypothetical protein